MLLPGPVSFDLVEVTGIEEIIGSNEMPPGRYNQIRMEVVEALITIRGEVKTATVPSSRLRLVGGFDVVAGQTTILTLDFDADKSVVIRGMNDPLLKPVVKLLVRTSGEDLTDATEVAEVSEPSPDATPTPTLDPTAIPQPDFELVARIESDGGGYFGGAASENLELIAIGGKESPGQEPGVVRFLTFFDADGNVLNKVDIGGETWAVAMTPDGEKTVAGSEDEKLYIFEGTDLVASGRPIPANGQIRGVSISDDGRYAVAGGFGVTVHDLTADDPITPIFVDSTTEQLRATDISADGRYVAYGGKVDGSNMYLGVFDLETRTRVFTDTIVYSEEVNAELRSIAISPDGNRIVAGDWGHFLHYYVRSDSEGTWSRVQSIDGGSRQYWVDMDASGTLAVVGVQGGGLRLYQMGESSLTLLWEFLGPPQLDGGQRYVSITRNGEYTTAGTRGGGVGGGRMFVFDPQGNVVFFAAADAEEVDGIYMASNGLTPEVWFTRVSEDGTRAVFASWNGVAYFYQR